MGRTGKSKPSWSVYTLIAGVATEQAGDKSFVAGRYVPLNLTPPLLAGKEGFLL